MEDNKKMFKDRVTIYEVAKVAGVSLATVSRVINNHQNVTEKTKKAVNDAIQRLGYKPSALAQGLANSRSTNIGIMIPSTGYSYVSNMLDGMIEVAKIYKYITSIFITKRTKEDSGAVIESLIKSHVDGAVIYDDELGTDEIRSIQNYHIPLIVVGHDMEGDSLGSIIIEYKDPVMDVVKEHMMSTKEDDVFILDIVNQGKMLDEIRDGLLDYAKANNRHIETITLNDSYSIVYPAMKEYFKTHRKGYFVAPRDSLATAVVNAALESGLRIPEDIEVLSAIGSKVSYMTRPEISSFSMDMFKVGSVAVRMLTKLLNENEQSAPQKTFRFRATYNKRSTTK
ncbi:MAG: LacI family DNA-binding transcriptional regulator [Candidatus Enterosoma sp.]|nr:LacI family transcriptional regulator [Bacilli bacterium]MDD7181674.1 LacI family DNA-binding transcriptional regulator [Bacilli bacterium]MDY3047266.1 LacI family DNA-binding transcriptional regulator [Candidatus Enterosoma sp.]